MDAATIIDGARSLDNSFSPNRHGARTGLEFLSRYQRELAGKVLTRESRIISEEISFALPLDVFEDGVVLEDTNPAPPPDDLPLQYDRIHGIELELINGDRLPIGIVPWKGRAYVDEWPVVSQRENTLILMGRESWWRGYVSIHVEYAPTPQLITDGADDLIFPDSALGCLTLAVGAEWCRRDSEACKRLSLPEEAKTAEDDWLDLIDERNDVEIGRVRRVFS